MVNQQGQEPTQKAMTDCVEWMIHQFPKRTKDEFMGYAKAQGKDWKKLLGHLMRAWIVEMKREG